MRRLRLMLRRDEQERPRPPVTLAGPPRADDTGPPTKVFGACPAATAFPPPAPTPHVRDDDDTDKLPTYGLSKLQNGASKPGDELQGDYTRERLLQMNGRFCERLERAIAHGDEHDSRNMDRPPPSYNATRDR